MKNLFKIAICFLVCLAGYSIKASAQTNGADAIKNSTPEQRAEMQNKMMKEELALNDEQYTKVSAINLKYAQQNQTLFADGGNRLSKARAFKKSMNEKDKELKTVLTNEQYKHYHDAVKDKMNKLKEHYKAQKS